MTLGRRRQRVLPAYEDVRPRAEERLEAQLGPTHGAHDDLAVVVAEVDDAHLAPLRAHVVDDAGRGALAQRELVLLASDLAHQLNEGVDHEGIVLAAHGKDAPDGRPVRVAALQQVRLLHHLAGVGQKPRAFLGGGHAAAGALEDLDAHLCLELANGLGEAGLRDEEPRGGGRDRSGVRHLDYVPELRERHGSPFRGHFSPLF